MLPTTPVTQNPMIAKEITPIEIKYVILLLHQKYDS